jgi:hypothetical protein
MNPAVVGILVLSAIYDVGQKVLGSRLLIETAASRRSPFLTL